MMALEGLFRKLEAATRRDRDSILRRMVALNGCAVVRAPQCVRHRHGPPRNGADDGPAHGSPWTMQVVKAIINHSTMKRTPLTPGGSLQDHVDNDTCVLTTCTLQGAVLDLAVVPSDRKPHVVASAVENAVLT